VLFGVDEERRQLRAELLHQQRPHPPHRQLTLHHCLRVPNGGGGAFGKEGWGVGKGSQTERGLEERQGGRQGACGHERAPGQRE